MGSRHVSKTSPKTALLVTMDEAEHLLRVSKRTISNWCADGRLDAIKIGNCKRIKMASIKKLIGE